MGSLSIKTLGLEWPKFRTLTTPNAAEEMEQQELSSIANWNRLWKTVYALTRQRDYLRESEHRLPLLLLVNIVNNY